MPLARDRAVLAALLGIWISLGAFPLHGQAWVPMRGQGDVTLSLQWIGNDGHRLTNGRLIPHGQSVDTSGFMEVDYGLTDRFSFTLGIPYVFTKYTDSQGPPPPLPYLTNDECHCWHGSWQDFGLTARYNIARSASGRFSLTPSVSAGVPSRNYQFRGESATGRGLKELAVAVDAGYRLDFLSPKISVTGRYSYTFSERVLKIPDDRSNAILEGRYTFWKGRLSARGFTMWQRTHGGLRLGSLSAPDLALPGEVDTPERLIQHDRLLRDNYFHAGGGVSYSFTRLDVFASYVAYVSGTDTHAGKAVTLGISLPFEWQPGR